MNTFSNFDDLANSMSNELCSQIDGLIAKGKSPVIALSGGTTPSPVYQRLASMDIDWDKCKLFMGDDRCVPFGNDRCNLTMAKRRFKELTLNGQTFGQNPYLSLISPYLVGVLMAILPHGFPI